MTEQDPQNLADRLIEAERAEVEPQAPAVGTVDSTFVQLLDEERRFEERVRRVALFSWALTFVCLLVLTTSFTIVREADDGALRELARPILILSLVTGLFSVLAAAFTSVTWLFRSRTPTLRAIERRLRALEDLLMSKDSP